MSRVSYLGVEEARAGLPDLLDKAEQGNATVITRRGRPVAALVPLATLESTTGQQSLLPLRGSGRGLWGASSRTTLRKLRAEWDR